MSEQSPWGTPPPSSPWGPPPAQPPAPPPAPPGGYYGGPGGPAGPGGPGSHAGPPRRNTGLIVGLVALVVALVVGAVVVVVLVAGGDDGGEEADPSSDPTSQSATETETETESTEPTEPTSPAESGEAGDPVVGDGYQYALPTGEWRDRSDQAAQLGATIDTVIVLGPSVELSQSAVFIEVLPNPGVTNVEDIRDAWARNVKSNDGATTETIDPITVDGEDAVGVDVDNRKNNAGLAIKQRAYLTLHDDLQVGIYLTYPASGDTVSLNDFQKVLDSWRWE